MLLIKNIDIYAPRSLGIKDVLLAGDKIVEIEDNIEAWGNTVKVIDGSGKKLLPGFIDQHVHITGGGGEGSFKTRVPEITLSKLTTAGITTVVGLLGTDSVSRSVEQLVSKAKGLKEEGVSVYAMTGSYDYPSITITGDVKKDICFIEEIIGCKIAVSDHRAPNISIEQLAQLASDARVAGMMSNKAGTLTVHIGDGKKGLKPLFEVLNQTDLPVTTMRPTHVNRTKELIEEAFDYAKMGGLIDLTCGIYKHLSPGVCIMNAIENDVPQENITVSSDGYGSWSSYDDKGNLRKIGVSSVNSLYEEFLQLVEAHKLSIENALPYFTSNIAKGLHLYPQKGCVAVGADADLLIVDEAMTIESVLCKGAIAVLEKEVLLYGTYE